MSGGEFVGVIYWMLPTWVATLVAALIVIGFETPWKWLALLPWAVVTGLNIAFVIYFSAFQM